MQKRWGRSAWRHRPAVIAVRIRRRRFACGSLCLLGLVLVAGGAVAGAQSAAPPVERIDPESLPRPALRAVRTGAPIAIDGRLDEPAWQEAESVSDFWQIIPRDGFRMADRTVVRVLYDDDNLYVGAKMYQAQPDRLRISGLEHDPPPYASDSFGVGIDPNFDRQNGFVFSINPAGAVWDGQGFNDSRYVNGAWDGVVSVRTQRDSDGWTAEVAIPFTTLRFKAADGDQTWGINFLRRVLDRDRRVDAFWAPMLRRNAIHTFSRAGTLTGLRGIKQGRNLQIKPWVGASHDAGTLRPASDRGGQAGAGLDVKYGVTSRLSMDASLFTDFSQAEVDQEQLNLTRFSLFFPEKREFFMDNAGIFTVGDVRESGYRTGSSPSNFSLFHSRRIGLSGDRRPIPIVGGGRLTGRVGDYEVGALTMQAREFGDSGTSGYTPAENFSVLRLRRYVMGNSDFGVLFTNRQATTAGFEDLANRTYAADLNLRPYRRLVVNSYVAASREPGAAGDRSAARVNVAWRDQLWDLSAFVKRVGDGFNPGLGFVQRTGMKQVYATAGAHPAPPIRSVAELNPYVEISTIAGLDGVLETRDVTAGLGAELNSGSSISLTRTSSYDRLEEVTSIAGASVPSGVYQYSETAFSFTPNASGAFSASLSGSRGSFYDGDRSAVSSSVLFRPDYHLTVNAQAQYNAVTLGGRSFTADIYSARVRYAYDTRLSAMAYVQFNNATDEVVGNFRITMIHAPLSHLFLVLTDRRYVGPDARPSTLLERSFSVKFTRLFQF
ncbi:MAG: carbohydrate binding family 9 domain-containing protein [Acidobacteria bacterium]|nr:carbohydrate binding family 9 domain-containing protein [Acidobacteriota bacterium]